LAKSSSELSDIDLGLGVLCEKGDLGGANANPPTVKDPSCSRRLADPSLRCWIESTLDRGCKAGAKFLALKDLGSLSKVVGDCSLLASKNGGPAAGLTAVLGGLLPRNGSSSCLSSRGVGAGDMDGVSLT
jgi:hypothetical protein